MEFERAIEYRELLNSVSQIAQKQKITDTGGEDRDIVALAREHEDAVVQVFFIRNGRLIGRDHFYLRIAQGDENAEILSSFIKQFYAGTPYIPGELMLPVEPEEREILEAWLGEKRGHKVHFRIPKKGEKEKLVELAAKNAKMVLEKDKERIKREEGRTIGAVKEIEKLLDLNNLVRMEAYDISNTNGFASVGSMIVYERGKPKRNDYRKFHIKGVQGADDYASMREVIYRRYYRVLMEGLTPPDMILVDGGLGQIHVAKEVVDSLNMNIKVCGLAKDDKHSTAMLLDENGTPIPIHPKSELFFLLTRMQDEVHRYAISFHKNVRSKSLFASVLDDIEGIGPKRKKQLLNHFKSVKRMKEPSLEELQELLPDKVAEELFQSLQED